MLRSIDGSEVGDKFVGRNLQVLRGFWLANPFPLWESLWSVFQFGSRPIIADSLDRKRCLLRIGQLWGGPC